MRRLPLIIALIAILNPIAGCKKRGEAGSQTSAETQKGNTTDTPSIPDADHVRETTSEELYKMLLTGKKTHLIDVREPGEFAGGSIRGAQLIPRGKLKKAIAEVAPNKNDRIDLFCAAGRRSAIATKTLQKMGYTQVYSLQGGFKTWTKKKLKLPATPPPVPAKKEEEKEVPNSEKTDVQHPEPTAQDGASDAPEEPKNLPTKENNTGEESQKPSTKEGGEAAEEEKKEEKPKPLGPDGVKQEKATETMLPGFPPKDTKPTGPSSMEEEFVDPRLAPDSAVIFDKNKLPLGHETRGNAKDLTTMPSALVFPFVDGQPGGGQKLRIDAVTETSIETIQIQEPKGPFRLSAASQAVLLRKGEGLVITVECDTYAKPHQTTLLIQTKTETEKIPLKLEVGSP